ncbi:MAG: endonuclease/exonuclease/phosphatase family protein [Anaerolineae bacterium]
MKHRRSLSWLYLIDGYHLILSAYLVLRLLIASRWWWLGVLHTFALWLFAPVIVTVLLALITRRWRRLALASAFLLIALVRFAPLPIGHITASDRPHDLRVLTFNVWKENSQFGSSLDWVLAQDADVLILQELVESHLDHLPRILAQYPHQTYVEGNVRVFSRYPFIESETVWIEDAQALRDGRLAVRTVVDVNGQAITIYGVHLSLPARDTPRYNLYTGIDDLDFILRYDEAARNQQIVNLAQRVQAETHPVIVAGDFNTSHTSPILGHLRAVGLRDAFRLVGRDWGMTWSHNPPTTPLIRIDYVWASPSLNPLRMQRGHFIGSDHLPLVVDYAFVP